MNQYFQNNQSTILQNYAWIKDLVKVQDGLLDFNVRIFEKFVDIVLGCHLANIFRKLSLAEYSYSFKIHDYLKRSFKYSFLF